MRVARRSRRAVLVCLALVSFSSSGAVFAEDGGMERVFVRGGGPDVGEVVRSLGGSITQRYQNLDLIAAAVPKERLTELMVLTEGKASRQGMIQPPRLIDAAEKKVQGLASVALEAQGVKALVGADLSQALSVLPRDYNFNNALIGASVLHAAGNTGQGIVVAVVDSGTANSPVVPSLFLGTPSVIGGESFVTGDPVASATSRRNGPHGTWVGGVIASHVSFGFLNTARPFDQAPCSHQPRARVSEPPHRERSARLLPSRGGRRSRGQDLRDEGLPLDRRGNAGRGGHRGGRPGHHSPQEL